MIPRKSLSWLTAIYEIAGKKKLKIVGSNYSKALITSQPTVVVKGLGHPGSYCQLGRENHNGICAGIHPQQASITSTSR